MFKRLFASLQTSPKIASRQDENGRPIAPHILELTNPGEASNQQIEQALEWAKGWLRSDAETDRTEMRDLVRKCLNGTASKKETPERAIAAMATRVLRLSACRNRHLKSKDAFPWAMLRLGPQVDPCKCARDLESRLIPVDDFLPIPLPGCDASICKCWFRSVTRREAEKSVACLPASSGANI